MNKHQYKSRVEELEFALAEKVKEFEYQKGEFGRLKAAYKMSEKQIRELQQGQKLPIDNVMFCACGTEEHSEEKVRSDGAWYCGKCKKNVLIITPV